MDWTGNGLVQKHLNEAADFVAENYRYRRTMHYSNTSLESPLKVVFSLWWCALACAHEIFEESVWLVPQHDVAVSSGRRYRLDFRLTPPGQLSARAEKVGIAVAKVAVELDGHDFHEKTKEQVQYRNQRDRDLQQDGWIVLHFSGSELNRDPAGCVLEAYTQAYRLFGQWDFECSIIDKELAQASGA